MLNPTNIIFGYTHGRKMMVLGIAIAVTVGILIMGTGCNAATEQQVASSTQTEQTESEQDSEGINASPTLDDETNASEMPNDAQGSLPDLAGSGLSVDEAMSEYSASQKDGEWFTRAYPAINWLTANGYTLSTSNYLYDDYRERKDVILVGGGAFRVDSESDATVTLTMHFELKPGADTFRVTILGSYDIDWQEYEYESANLPTLDEAKEIAYREIEL